MRGHPASASFPKHLAVVGLLLALVACSRETKDAAPRDTAKPVVAAAPPDSTTPPGVLPPGGGVHAMPEACNIGARLSSRSDVSKFVSQLEGNLPDGRPRDLGIGLLILRSEPSGAVHGGDFVADSLIFRESPDSSAPVSARFVVRSIPSEGVRYFCGGFTFVTDTALQHHANLFESGQRSLTGFPVDSISADSTWFRVAYALDTTFVPHVAWVGASGTEMLGWHKVFASAGPNPMIEFRDSASRDSPGSALRSSPNGPPASVKLPRGAVNWSMYLRRVDGQWGEVELRTGDVCDDTKPVPGRFWVKLIDERGRPQVLLPAGEIC